MPSDGAIVIDTAINNSGFLRDARVFRSTVQGLKSTVDRVGAAMNRSGNSYGQALRSQAKDANELKRQLDALNDRYVAVVREMNQLQKSGGDAGRYRELAKEAQTLSAKMAELRRTGAGEALDKVAESASRARTSIAAIAGGAVKTGFHKLLGVVQKLGKAIASLFHRSRGGGNFFSVKNLLAYGLGIRSLYALFSRLRTAVKDGLGSLAEYDPRVRAAVNSMSAALSSLRGSLSTAFAPILTAVAPALITLINLLTRAVNAIGMFIAALTGQSFYTVAAGVSAVGGAAKGSSGAVKDLKRQLAGFDELNILSDTGGGGGSSGGGGGLGGLEYTKVPIADWLNEAIQNDNFALIGQKLAQKLNESLDKIDWDAIKRRAKDVVRKLTDILNGFIGEINPQSLGRTLAGVINTAAAIVGDFFDRTKWEDLGRVVKNSLMDALRRLSVNDIARALLAPIKAGINYLKGLLPETTPEWHEITGKLVSILVKAIQDFPAADLGDVIGRLINGAFSLIKDLADARTLTKIAKKIVEAIQAAIKRIDLNLIKEALISFLQDAWEALKVLIGLDLSIGGVKVLPLAMAFAAGKIGKGILKLFGGTALAKNGGLAWKGAVLAGAIGCLIEAAIGISDVIKNKDGMTKEQFAGKIIDIIGNLALGLGGMLVQFNPFTGAIVIAVALGIKLLPSIVSDEATEWANEHLSEGVAAQLRAMGFNDAAEDYLNSLNNSGTKSNPDFGYNDTSLPWSDLLHVDQLEDNVKDVIEQAQQGVGRSEVIHLATTLDPPSESAFQRVKQSIADWFNTKMEPIRAKMQAVLDDDSASNLKKTLANTVLNIDANVKTFLEKGWSGSVAKALGIPQEVYVGISLTKGSNGTVTMVVDSKNKTATVKAGSNAKPGTIIVTPNATGGVFANGFWRALPQYARGTASAHGSLFLAGEAGPEIVGHVGGRTEVLNKSQLAATMFAAVRSAMQGVQVNVDLGEIASASWMDKLAAHIGNYQAPAMASGSVLPYDVAAQIAKTGQDIQTAMDANTDDLIQTIVSVAGQIVAALNRPQPTGGQSGATAQDVINEINRRTLMFGASPLQGV